MDKKSGQKTLIIIFTILWISLLAAILVLAMQHKKNNKLPSNSGTFSTSSLDIKARDLERRTDINAIHAQVEAYWAENGYYPSLKNLNDSTYIDTNLRGLDKEALKDPLGSSSELVSEVTDYAYAYTVLPKDCDNIKTKCTSYTMSAKYEQTEDGINEYKKYSLNQ